MQVDREISRVGFKAQVEQLKRLDLEEKPVATVASNFCYPSPP